MVTEWDRGPRRGDGVGQWSGRVLIQHLTRTDVSVVTGCHSRGGKKNYR